MPLKDGTLTFVVTLTDAGSTAMATATATLDTASPSGYSIETAQVFNATTAKDASFLFENAEVGDAYLYIILNTSGEAHEVSGYRYGYRLERRRSATSTFLRFLTDRLHSPSACWIRRETLVWLVQVHTDLDQVGAQRLLDRGGAGRDRPDGHGGLHLLRGRDLRRRPASDRSTPQSTTIRLPAAAVDR